MWERQSQFRYAQRGTTKLLEKPHPSGSSERELPLWTTVRIELSHPRRFPRILESPPSESDSDSDSQNFSATESQRPRSSLYCENLLVYRRVKYLSTT